MSIKFTADVLLGSGIGFVVGAFMPRTLSNIKALWVKETQIAMKPFVNFATGAKAEVVKVVEKL